MSRLVYHVSMLRLFALLLILPSLSYAADPAALPTEPGFRGIWYMNQPQADEYRFKYSGGFATYPQQHIPLAVYRAEVDRTYFVYGGRGDNDRQIRNMISYFDHKTQQVARPRVVLTRNTNDAHYNPTLAIDSGGHIYVFCNSHGQGAELAKTDPTFGKSYIYRSLRPWDIDASARIREDNFSYSQVWPSGPGLLWLHTRYAGNLRRLFWSASGDGQTWPDPRPLAAMGAGGYQVSWSDGRRVATAMDYHPPKGGLNARTNIYYLETRDRGKTWTDAAGRGIAVPLDQTHNPALIHDFENDGLLVYLKDLSFDDAGRPIILYLTSKSYKSGPEGEPRTWWTAHWTGDQWRFRQVTRSDHNYDHGSLYIDAKTWRIIAPTDPGPQAWATGGAIVIWISEDEGQTWRRQQGFGAFNGRNQTYVRRPLFAKDPFYAFWADGNALQRSESDLYFATSRGEIFRLPRRMSGEFARPQPVHTPD